MGAVTAEGTRDRILAATIAVLERDGPDAVRVLSIAEDASVTTGAIYHHFDNRRSLLVAAQLQRFAAAIPEDVRLIVGLLTSAHSADDLRAGFAAITAVAYLPERASNRAARSEVVSAARTNPELAAALSQQQHGYAVSVREAVASAQARGVMRADTDPHALAVLMMALPFGFQLADIDREEAVDLTSWAVVVGRVVESFLAD